MKILGILASITSSENHGMSKGDNQEDALKIMGEKGLDLFSVIFAIDIGYPLHAWLFRYWISGFLCVVNLFLKFNYA